MAKPFKGEINLSAKASKPDWDAFLPARAPERALTAGTITGTPPEVVPAGSMVRSLSMAARPLLPDNRIRTRTRRSRRLSSSQQATEEDEMSTTASPGPTTQVELADTTTSSISERESREIEAANASGSAPVVFIHGLWLLPSSWANWADFFEQAGYAPLTPDWPDDPETVEEARANPDVLAKKTLGQVADHTTEVIGALDRKPVIMGHSTGGLLAQILAGRGFSAVTVAIDPGVFRGVLPLPASVLKGVGPFLVNPLTRGRGQWEDASKHARVDRNRSSGEPTSREHLGEQSAGRVSHHGRLLLELADHVGCVVGNLLQRLLCEDVRIRPSLFNRIWIIWPVRRERCVAGLLEEVAPVGPAARQQPEAMDEDDRGVTRRVGRLDLAVLPLGN